VAGDHITYDYIVTTRSNPDLVSPDSILTTTDTFGIVSNGSLVNGTTYYIHVRVDIDDIVYNGNNVFDQFSCSSTGVLPWTTIRFVACSSAATVGTITPGNAVVCPSSTVTLTATSGFTTYQWYNQNNTAISGATSATYNAPAAGQYKIYVTKSGSTCQGMVATTTVLPVSTQTGHLTGAGNFYVGDTVRLKLDSTVIGQTYKILKDGVEVYSVAGIGYPEQEYSSDTISYNFAIASSAQAGLYTVRVSSPYCSTVDYGNVQVSLVNGATICPSGDSTVFSFLSTGNNTSFRWQVNNNSGSGFTNITDGGIYSGATTKYLKIKGATSTMYGYQYRCVCTGGTAVTSSPRILKFGETWIGATSTAWATASNWSCGVVPDTNIDVIIQKPASNRLPVIAANTTVHSVVVAPGATLQVNSGAKLTVTGQ
jgi:hypothetical protein